MNDLAEAERQSLPTGAYSSIRRSTVDGCLLIALRRADEFGG
jgi:hypothetical protein